MVTGPVEFASSVKLHGEPVSDNDAVNKKYVDDLVVDIPEQIYYTNKGVKYLKQYVIVNSDAYDDPDSGLIY